jgi:hypothetical protein
MVGKLVEFFQCEDGAVTVDWVVLTAAVVGVALVFMIPITQGAQTTSAFIGATITSAQN